MMWEELNFHLHNIRNRFALCDRTGEELREWLAGMDEVIADCKSFVSRPHRFPEASGTLELMEAHRAEIIARLQRQ
jgi:hypothetical protein